MADTVNTVALSIPVVQQPFSGVVVLALCYCCPKNAYSSSGGQQHAMVIRGVCPRWKSARYKKNAHSTAFRGGECQALIEILQMGGFAG